MTSPPFNAAGAIDLGALASAKQAQAKADAAMANAPEGEVFDATVENFEELVMARSMTVPVIVDLWATWCQPCKTLSPILEGLAAEYGGRFVLAKIDVDAQQQLGAMFQVQSIPTVVAIIGGQAAPLFQGAVTEQQARQVIDQVLAAAAQAGINGTLTGEPADELPVVEDVEDPRFAAAYDAVDAGDWAAARAAYQSILDTELSNADAIAGLALIGLYERTDGLDTSALIEAARANPSDVAAVLAGADALALSGDWGAAFALLLEAVRATSGDERDAVRTRLVELFEIAGDDPAVPPSRIALSNALF